MERNANGSTQTASDQQNAEHFISIAFGFFGSRALYVAAELGIADHLSDGPKSVAQLAAMTGSHQQSLYRLLRMLAMLGVFVEKKNGEFESNALGALLRSGAMRDAAMIIGDADWNAYGALSHSIRTGKPSFRKASWHEFLGLPEFSS